VIFLGSFGGFYKGDKKKSKKDTKKGSGISSAPVLVMPELISKKKKDY